MHWLILTDVTSGMVVLPDFKIVMHPPPLIELVAPFLDAFKELDWSR